MLQCMDLGGGYHILFTLTIISNNNQYVPFDYNYFLVAVANIQLVVVAAVVARRQLLFRVFKEVVTSCLLSRGVKQDLGSLF